VITRAIGTAETVEPDIFTGDLESGDIVLLTSDGLTRYADSKAIAMLILSSRNLAEACQALIDRAKQFGAVDNVTCLLLQFLPAEDRRAEEAPVAAEPAAEAPPAEMPAADLTAPEVAAEEAPAQPVEAPEGEKAAEEAPTEPSVSAVEKAFAEMLAEETSAKEPPGVEKPVEEAPAAMAMSDVEKAFAEMLAEEAPEKPAAEKQAAEGEAE